MGKNMKGLYLMAILVIVASGLPNFATYITEKDRPLNIAHRGLSSILPQNTMQAFEAAIYQGADFIELDVVYTKDKELLVMHDPFLTRITNIKDHPEFSTRYETRKYGSSQKRDWWTDTFTLNELRTLGIKQAQAPGRISVFDYKFTFPTLSQVIEMLIQFNQQHQGKRNPDNRLAGVLIQAKDSQMYRDLYGLQIGETILQVLRKYNLDTIQKAQKVCPIYLHSFDYGTVKYWAAHTELPRNYLLLNGTTFDLEDINKYATGIGFQDSIIYDYTLSQITKVMSRTRELGMQVHVWVFRDDLMLFNATTNIKMYKMAQNEFKVDAVITQFCDIYAPIAQLLREQNQKTKSFNLLHED